LGALAADVAEKERRAAVGEREQVVEVAANLGQSEGLVVHSHIEARDEGQAGRRQRVLQRAGQRFRAMLVAQRLASPGLLVVDLGGERLAVAVRVESLLRRQLAVARRSHPILGGQPAICGGLCAALGGAAALPGGADDRVGGTAVARVVRLLEGGIELGHRRGARTGGLVTQLRGEIAARGDLVALGGGAQPRPPGLVAPAGGPLARAARSLADVVAELVCAGVGAVDEVAIAGGLIAVGGQLIGVGARLVLVGARLVCVRQRLVAVGERLLVDHRPLPGVAVVLLSLDAPVAEARRRIA
jgi:hypothetical protein